jgi:hypothetical protein
MKWVIDFYNQRRAIVARYDVDAPTAAAAVVLGRQAMLLQYPRVPRQGRLTLFERAERIGGQDDTGWIVYRIAKGVPVLLIVTLVLLGASSLAHADVPKPADIVACNDEAQEATRKGSDSRGASPTARDHGRAADARRGDASSASGAGAPRAADPQLEGMDPDGAKDPAYQAAYRTCMRKAGF